MPGHLNPAEYGDGLLDAARYVGILRSAGVDPSSPTDPDSAQVTLAGVGLEAWLGDEGGKGDVIETPGVTVTSASFAAAVAAVLKPSCPAGTLHTGVSGTISNTFSYVTPRTALDYICTTFASTWGTAAQPSWQVRATSTAPHCVVDAGPAGSLFRMTPTCVIVRRDAGYDLSLKALPGSIATTRDAKEYSSRVVLVAAALAGGTADATSVPYTDLNGNVVKITRVIDEQDDTLVANAPARAAAALAQWNGINSTVRLSADDFDIAGDFGVGDAVWVYDPDGGIYDTGQQVDFRGGTLQPAAVRVLSLTWPIEAGYTVAYRSGAGTWTDLTPWIAWEASGGGEIEVADAQSSALTSGIGTIGTQVAGSGGGNGDAAIPGVPVFGAFTTSSYQSGDGLPKAVVKVAWTQPLNTDSSTIVDGDHYDLRYRVTGAVDWTFLLVPFDQTSVTITDLPPATGYDWAIRAVDYASPINYGAWSATTAFTTSADTIPPGVPAAASVAASKAAVQVTHTLGLASGGTYNLPADMDHLEVHLGASSGFVTSAATLAGKLTANLAMLVGGLPAVGSFATAPFVGAGVVAYVRVIAVDRSGNRSTASAAAGATATLWDSAYISDLTASKITAGTITAAVVIGGSATFSGALSAATGTFAGTLSAVGGTFTGNLSAVGGTFAGSLSAVGGTFTGTLSGATGTFTGTVQTGTSGPRIVLDPTGVNPTLWLYPSTGDAAFLNATSSTAAGFNSSTGGGSTRTRVLLSPTTANLTAIVASTQAQSGGSVTVTTTGASLTTTNGTASVQGNSGVSVTTSTGTATVTGATQIRCTTNSGSAIFGSSNNNYCQFDGSTATITGGGATSYMTITSTTIDNTSTAFKVGSLVSSAVTTVQPNVYASPTTGQLYRTSWVDTAPSSLRYKVGVSTAEVGIDVILAMRPVRYYDRAQVQENDGSFQGLRQDWGFIAEEVAQLPELDAFVGRNDQQEPDSLRYTRLVVPLVAAVQQLAARVAALEAD